jgi:hypothetical protein
MGKRILVSENEKEQIRSLHENQKKEINYFQILENKVNELLMEQDPKDITGVYLDGKQGSLPALRPGETRDNGQISSTKSEELKPFTVDLTANFPANVTKPYNPTPEDLKKLEGLVAWLNNPQLKTSSVEIKVNSGSSKTGNFEDNKRLAIERGRTGIDYIKNYLKGKIKTDVYDKIVFPEPNDSLANQGPEPKKATAKEYEKFQKFQIIADAKGTIETKSTREVKIELYKFPPVVDGAVLFFNTGNATKLANALNITDKNTIQELANDWPDHQTNPVVDTAISPSQVGIFSTRITDYMQFKYVTFCVKGFTNYRAGQYSCSDQNKLIGYRQVYASVNNGRWLPYPSLNWIEGIQYSPFFQTKVNTLLPDAASQMCFLAEGYKGEYKKQFFNIVESSPFCQAKYSQWPDYSYKLAKKEVPGPESIWYKDYLSKSVWYTEGTTNGGLWTIPSDGKADTTKG